MKTIKKICKKIIIKIWRKKHICKDENYEYFFCPSGIGDTLYVLGYMREYKRNFQNKKVIFIVKEAHKFLVDMYSKYVDGTIVVSKFYHKLIEQHLKENLNIEKKIIYAHPLKIISDPCKILGVKDICLLDLYKILLNISIDSEICKPSIDNKIKAKVKEENNITEKSVLICPYCISIPMIDKSIWEAISNSYIEKGYKVFTNVKDATEEPIKGTIPISLSLDNFCSVIEEFRQVYAIRSGLCDLMSFFNVNLTALYPSDEKTGKSNSFKQYNFKNIGIRNDIHEVIVKEGRDEVIKKILEKDEEML